MYYIYVVYNIRLHNKMYYYNRINLITNSSLIGVNITVILTPQT